MSSPHIIVPGAPLPAAPTKQGGVSFSQAESTKEFQAIHAGKGERAEDVLIGNPSLKPFAVVVPILRHPESADLEHVLIFVRCKSGMDALGQAPIIWEKYIKPDYYPVTADFTGTPNAKSIDEQDWIGYWRSAVRMYKQDAQKHPMVAFGHPTFPHAFCSIKLLLDFNDMKSFQVHDSKRV